MVAGGCLESVCKVSGRCLKDVWKVSRLCKVSGCFLEGAWTQTILDQNFFGPKIFFGPKVLGKFVFIFW